MNDFSFLVVALLGSLLQLVSLFGGPKWLPRIIFLLLLTAAIWHFFFGSHFSLLRSPDRSLVNTVVFLWVALLTMNHFVTERRAQPEQG